jgi:hypothetical protein
MSEKIKISKTSIRAMGDSDARQFLWDAGLPGFGAVKHPTGRVSFVFQYRDPAGRSRRITIGPMTEALGPEQAREIAKAHALAIAQGKDPASPEAPEVRTVDDLLDRYLASHAWRSKTPGTQASDLGRMKHLRTLIGKCLLERLTLLV